MPTAIHNVEIKARADLEPARRALESVDARYVGTDHQVDTYFIVDRGRLKLREGSIEKALIYYRRPNHRGPKDAHVLLYRADDPGPLKQILTSVLGVDTVVRKTREIYFVGNVKVHLDLVPELGQFVEIEAIDEDGTLGRDRLQSQVEELMDLLGLDETHLQSHSYADMVGRRVHPKGPSSSKDTP